MNGHLGPGNIERGRDKRRLMAHLRKLGVFFTGKWNMIMIFI